MRTGAVAIKGEPAATVAHLRARASPSIRIRSSGGSSPGRPVAPSCWFRQSRVKAMAKLHHSTALDRRAGDVMVKTRASSSSAGRCYASSSSSAVPGDGQTSDGAAADPEAGADKSEGKSPDGKPVTGGSSGSSLREKLAELGIAGILAYGLLNTLYYTVAFLFFYLCVIHPPRGLGYSVAVRKLAEAMALTWAGSQVTKIPRIAAAVALAPFIDRLLDFTTKKTGVGREKATGIVVAACFLFAAAIFGVLVAVWA